MSEVADLFGERIVKGKFIFPWRFAATDHESRPVSMNPNIMSGRLVVTAPVFRFPCFGAGNEPE